MPGLQLSVHFLQLTQIRSVFMFSFISDMKLIKEDVKGDSYDMRREEEEQDKYSL